MNGRDPFAGWFAEPEAGPAGGAASDTRWAFAPLFAVLVILAVLAWLAVLAGGNDDQVCCRIQESHQPFVTDGTQMSGSILPCIESSLPDGRNFPSVGERT